MKIIPTHIPEVILIEPVIHKDKRGFFMETYHSNKFAKEGLHYSFVQDNHAKSVQHTLRGLHFQKQFPQGKLIRCLQGSIFDVAVDIRPESQYYGQWVGAELNNDNNLNFQEVKADIKYLDTPLAQEKQTITDLKPV